MTHDRPAASASPSRGFRSDVQGVRALAVLGIIAYHAGISPYAGGFVTLDVFFVVSGFLITFLLLREIDRTGTLSLRDFYRRRARRILPAATVATIGTMVAAWLWLSVVAAEEAAEDAVWAAVFAANVRFAVEETDYFAATEPPSPFQHYWSLSVEEQFYVVLPLLLIGGIALAHRRARRHAPDRPVDPVSIRRMLALLVGAVTAASLAWSIHASQASPETAYFSTFTRTWEFGVGALVAILGTRLARRFRPAHRNALAVTGLGMVVVAGFTVTEADAYPGHLALLPVVGTALVMIAGAELGDAPEPWAQRMLGVAPLRAIGDWSYSLYLWHWPVLIVATGYVGRELSPRGLVLAIAATFAVSYASFRLVETPFRRGMPRGFGRGLVLYPAGVGAVLVTSLVAVTVVPPHGATGGPITVDSYQRTPEGKQLDEKPSVALVQASARAAEQGAPMPADVRPALTDLSQDRADVDCHYDDAGPWETCRRGDTDAERSIVVLGNSHGRHWVPAMEKIAKETGYAAYYFVKPSCTAARVDQVIDGEVSQECADFNAWAQQQVERIDPDLAVVSTSDALAIQVDGEVVSTERPDAWVAGHQRGFEALLADLEPHVGRTVVLGDVPRRRSDIGQCLGRRDTGLEDCTDRPLSVFERLTAASKEAAREQDADFVPTKQWFCAEGRCPPVIGDTIPMRDDRHVTTAYAEKLAGALREELDLTAPNRSG